MTKQQQQQVVQTKYQRIASDYQTAYTTEQQRN
jgi:hypothetical protein